MEKQLTEYLEKVFSLLWSYGYVTLPALLLLLILIIQTRPKLFLAFFKFEQKCTDYVNPAGPWLSAQDSRRLKQLKLNQQTVIAAKIGTEKLLCKVYDQTSLNIRGFNRALLIAYYYPVAFMFVNWLITDGPLQLGQVQIASEINWYQKLGILISSVVIILIAKFYPNIPINFKLKEVILKPSQWITVRNVQRKNIFDKKTIFFGIGTYTLVVGVVVAVAVVVAGMGAVAVAVAVTVAVAGAGVGAITVAGTIAIAVVGAVVDTGTGTGTGTIVAAAAVALALSYAGTNAFRVFYEQMITKSSAKYHLIAILGLVSLASIYLSSPLWLGSLVVIRENTFQANSISFVFIFFFVVLPLINGLSDWLSVSVTQFCLGRYNLKKTNWLLWLGIDLLVAILMLLMVFFCVFAMLHLMAMWGWQISNAQASFEHFKSYPFAPENRWLVLLVLTNLLPTLIHLGLIVAGQVTGWFFAVTKNVDALIKKAELARQLSPEEKVLRNPSDYTWSEVEASDVAEYVIGIRVIWGLLVASLLIPFSYCAYYGVTQTLHYLVVTMM